MKKLNLVICCGFLVLATLATACSEEPEALRTEGKWIFDTVSYTKGDYSTEASAAYDPDCADRNYFYLKAGGNMESGVVNSSKEQQDPCLLKISSGSWKYENKILYVDLGTGELALAVESMSATKLVFRYLNPNNSEEYYTYTLKRK